MQEIGVGGPDQCKLGRLPYIFAGGKSPTFKGKSSETFYPQRAFIVSQMEINKIDQVARTSALSKIKLKPTLEWSWLLTSRNHSVLRS